MRASGSKALSVESHLGEPAQVVAQLQHHVLARRAARPRAAAPTSKPSICSGDTLRVGGRAALGAAGGRRSGCARCPVPRGRPSPATRRACRGSADTTPARRPRSGRRRTGGCRDVVARHVLPARAGHQVVAGQERAAHAEPDRVRHAVGDLGAAAVHLAAVARRAPRPARRPAGPARSPATGMAPGGLTSSASTHQPLFGCDRQRRG